MKFSIGNALAGLRKRFAGLFGRKTPVGRSNEFANPDSQLEKKMILKIKSPRLIPSFGQITNLPKVLKRGEWIVFGAALGVFAVAAAILIVQSLLYFRTVIPADGGTYVEAAVGRSELVNPLWDDANAVDRDLTRLIYAGLFKRGLNGEIENDLAEKVNISDDGKTYTVTLKSNLTWHDDAPLTSADVVFTIEAIKNPVYKSRRLADFRDVAVTASDESVIEFRLGTPFAPFLQALTVGILPAHLWADIPPESARLADFNIKPIGSGPYRFKSLKKTKQGGIYSYLLVANKDFHGQKPYINQINFRFYTDYGEATEALGRRNVDGLSFVPQEFRSNLSHNKQLVYYDLKLSQITAMFFNQAKNALLSDNQIRKALAHGIDKTAIIRDAFGGEAIPLNGPILPNQIGYDGNVTEFDFNLEKAKSILEDNGFKSEQGKTGRVFFPKSKSDKRFVSGSELKIHLVTVSASQYAKAAEMIRDNWRSIGVNVDLSIIDPLAIERQVISNRDFDILLYGEILGADTDPYPFWHSSQTKPPGVNLAGYGNNRVDALLEEGRILSDENERAKRYQEFQKIISNDLPAVFLLSPTYSYAIDARVHGAKFGVLADPADRFNSISSWFIKTKSKFGK